ncbi:MAG: IS21 family transposase [Candidatus Aenigmatarchaeota archaeon]|nr:MAG: IS21 family transposase [Candidatus Aenigmarchaeota archaeon]
MLKMNHYYAIQTLLDNGISVSQIAKQLNIDRKTVRKIRTVLQQGTLLDSQGNLRPPTIERHSQFDPFREEIKEYLDQGFPATVMCRLLNEKHHTQFKYNSLKVYVQRLRPKETYVPQLTPIAEEAQVDFGYAGYVLDQGKKRKTWVFCMVLGYSRYAYYELTTDQKVETFIRCHIHAFEFFGGCPKIVRIDNLKAAVLEASLYEPIYQREYSQFLSHYQCQPITCRIRRGQDKGKVESGVKYFKSNFLKGRSLTDFTTAQQDVKVWVNQTCNQRIHGTTKRIPAQEFTKEKSVLTTLPSQRYEIYSFGKRRVNSYGHVCILHNFYSVPFQYRGEDTHFKSNGSIITFYNGNYEPIATHPLSKDTGQFITKPEHIDPHKIRKSDQHFETQAHQSGMAIHQFLTLLKEKQPWQWHRMMNGVFQLIPRFTAEVVNLACQHALKYQLYGYQAVKRICEKKLYVENETKDTSVRAGGFNHDLKSYDILTERSSQ